MRAKKKTLFTLTLFLLFSACSYKKATQDSTKHKPQTAIKKDVIVERLQQDILVNSSHKELIINNPYGDIFVRKTSEPFVGVLSTTQVFSKSHSKALIKVFKDSKKIRVNINYDKSVLKLYKDNIRNIGRVDLVVFVPEQLYLTLNTHFGVINIKELKNDLNISSESGTIKTSSSGSIKIKTTSGNIFTNLLKPKWKDKSFIKTKSGNIILTFPKINKLNLNAQSGKDIHINFNEKISKNNNMYHLFHSAKQNTINLYSKKGFIKLVSVDQNNVLIKPGKKQQ